MTGRKTRFAIDYERLMGMLERRIADRQVLKLIRMWLKCPVVEDDGRGGRKTTRPKKGTPQGGVICPLLANLYLHEFDQTFHEPDGPRHWANAWLTRYADDFVVPARYLGKRIGEWLTAERQDSPGQKADKGQEI